MRPLVEATVADETGLMGATFFNQPWLEKKYRPGTRLALTGKYEGRNRFRVQQHAPTNEAAGTADDVAVYAATDGITSTQILTLVQRAPADRVRHDRAAAGQAARGAAPARPRRRAAGRARRRARAGASGSRSRSCSLDQIVQLRLRDETRRALEATPLDARADAERDVARARSFPFTPTGDQLNAMAEVDARPRARRGRCSAC